MEVVELKKIDKKDLEDAIVAHDAYVNGKLGARRLILDSYDLNNSVFRNSDLRDADFTNCSLVGADFSGANLKSASFFAADLSYANFQYCNLTRADLRGARFHNADLTNADLSGADLREGVIARKTKDGVLKQIAHESVIKEANNYNNAHKALSRQNGIIGSYADFSGAIMREVKFVKVHSKNAIFSGADLTNCDFSDAMLEGADFHDSIMSGAITSGAKLHGVDFSNVLKNLEGKNLEQAELVAEKLDDHIAWRKSMGKKGHPQVFDGQDLRAAHNVCDQPLTALRARNAVLCGLNFSGSELQGAILTDSDMRGCDFSDCDLRGINMENARLQWAIFKYANFEPLTLSDGRKLMVNLSGADLSHCDLSGVDLSNVRLRGANIKSAKLFDTIINPMELQYLKYDDSVKDIKMAI